jgi:hypothetical protein
LSHFIGILTRLFVPKREEVAGERRKLRNEEPHNFCCSPNVIRIKTLRELRWERNVAYMGKKANACKDLKGKSEGTASLGKPSSR